MWEECYNNVKHFPALSFTFNPPDKSYSSIKISVSKVMHWLVLSKDLNRFERNKEILIHLFIHLYIYLSIYLFIKTDFRILFCHRKPAHETGEYKWNSLNPNKAGLFLGRFFWGGGQFDPPSYFKKNESKTS